MPQLRIEIIGIVAEAPNPSSTTGKKLRAKDRPLANDFVSDEAFDKLLADWFGNIARVLAPSWPRSATSMP